MTTDRDHASAPPLAILAPDQFARVHAHLVGQARRQVDDADEAEDLVQETLIAAWQAGVDWSPATLDRLLADRCSRCQADRQADPGHPAAAAMTTDAGLADVELRLTIVEGLRRSAAGELGVAVFALRRAGLRPADVRAAIGGPPDAINDALAMLGRIARRVVGIGAAGGRPPDRPRDGRAPASPPPSPALDRPGLLAVPPALARTHPIAAALVRAGAPVAAPTGPTARPAPPPAPRAGDERADRPAVPPPSTATIGVERLLLQRQERERAVERTGRCLEQMRDGRARARTPDERAVADTRLAAAAVRHERARAALGDLERQLAAPPAATPAPRPGTGQTRRGRR